MLLKTILEYSYFYVPNKLNQTATVTATAPGIIDSVGIVTGGSEYRINEVLEFNNNGTQGQGVSAKNNSHKRKICQ